MIAHNYTQSNSKNNLLMADILVKKDIDQSELFKNRKGYKGNHG